MKPKTLLFILHAIKYNLSTDQLDKLGLTYSQIAKLIKEATEQEYIESDEKFRLKLTQSGEEKYIELTKKVFPDVNKTWLYPNEEYRIDKMDIFDVYLPKRKI